MTSNTSKTTIDNATRHLSGKRRPSPINRNGGRALFLFAAFSAVFIGGNAVATLASTLIAENPAKQVQTRTVQELDPEIAQLEAATSKFATCDARNAGKKAREMGLQQTRVVLDDGERFVVTGRKNGHRARISFSNAPHCPVVTAIGL